MLKRNISRNIVSVCKDGVFHMTISITYRTLLLPKLPAYNNEWDCFEVIVYHKGKKSSIYHTDKYKFHYFRIITYMSNIHHYPLTQSRVRLKHK